MSSDGSARPSLSEGSYALSTPSIAVVVLNWNGVEDTLECLSSLQGSVTPVHAIVVDNGSTGTDAERIRRSGLADTVIETGANLGYAGGNNVGLRHALASGFEVIGVLNNDTVANARSFADIAEHLEEHTTHLALAPTILYDDDPARVWFAGGLVEHGWPRHLQPSELNTVERPLRRSEWLTGCCIVARADTWRRVGLFDPRYFLIFEDCEWSLRARDLGVELSVATEVTIRHKVSQSFTSQPSSRLGSYYYIRNGLRFEWSYARRSLPRFLVQHLIRPTLSDALRWDWRPGLGFRWLGALSFVAGRTGAAPDSVTRRAGRQQ